MFWLALALFASPLQAMTQEEYNAMGAAADAAYAAGDWDEAVTLYDAFAGVANGFFGPDHVETLYIQSKLAFALEKAQRFEEVEVLAAAAMAAGADNPAATGVLIDLRGSFGRALYVSGQGERALAEAERAVADAEAYAGPTAPLAVILRLDRARAAASLERAEFLERAAEDYAFVAETTRASPDPAAQSYAAQALREGAWIALRQLNHAKAAALSHEAVAIFETTIGPDHFDTISTMQEEVDAVLEVHDGDLAYYAAALATATEAAARADRAFGPGSALAAETLAQRGYLMLVHIPLMPLEGLQIMDIAVQEMESIMPADSARLARWRGRLATVIALSPSVAPEWGLRGVEVTRAAVATKSVGLPLVIAVLKQAEASGALDNARAAEEALGAVQELQFGMAPAVMGFWQKRLEQGSGEGHELFRAFTDATLISRRSEKELLALLSGPAATRDAAAIAALKERVAAERAEGDRIAAELALIDPTFGANFSGQVLGLEDLRALLGPEEAVVVVVTPDIKASEENGLIVAVSREAISWAPLDKGPGDYMKAVAALREAVQVRLGVRSAIALSEDEAAAPKRVAFDPAVAASLYADTLAKVAPVIAGKTHLYLDLRGPISALPPQLMLVTPFEGEDWSKADWLIRHHALTVVPSLTSLRTIALARKAGTAPEPLLAFGDPDYASGGAAAGEAAQDLTALRGGLDPLPETAGEVREVALALGAGEDALRLAGQASEAALKSADLSQFRVLHFATHGLVSGDAVGPEVLGEPALALTAGQGEDGFLKASEILGLRLNADLVVLSACNTALGSSPDEEALSGLAQAFLYAGAKSLLVSHWPVESKSAARLMTETFRIRAETPGMTDAHAQQRAIIEMIDQGGRWSHPAYWAPFVLVGSSG